MEANFCGSKTTELMARDHTHFYHSLLPLFINGTLGGTPPKHKAKLEEYARELSEITKQNQGKLMDDVNRTLQDLNVNIKKRIQGQSQ